MGTGLLLAAMFSGRMLLYIPEVGVVHEPVNPAPPLPPCMADNFTTSAEAQSTQNLASRRLGGAQEGLSAGWTDSAAVL
jgi:hypothetical protein